MASKILAIAYPFAKFAKVFSRQNFPLYGTTLWYQRKYTCLDNFIRSQRVVCGGEVSDLVDILSGVPQGSVLGL